MPDGTIIKDVPEGTTKSELQRRLSAFSAPKEQNPAQQAARQAFLDSRAARENPAPRQLRPAISQFDVPADVGMNLLSSLVATPASGIAGLFGGADAVEKVGNALTYQPRTIEGQQAVNAIAYPFQKLAQAGDYVGGEVADATGLPSAGAAANTAVQAIPALISRGRGTANAGRGLENRAGGKAPSPANAGRASRLEGVPPTIEELSAQAKDAYKRASDAGVSIAPESFQNLKNRIGSNLSKDGLDPTLHPQTTAAWKRIRETKGAVSLEQLETLRKIANDARGTVSKPDARMAGRLVDEIDAYMGRVGRNDITSGDPKGFAALREARDLYSRKSKAEEIARLVKRAEDSAPNFSASGYENALRIQFKQLAMNDKKMRRFNAEEQAAIRKVARGGPLENALRMLGKLAPTGVISGTVGVAAATALPGGALIPAAGLAGRYAATRLTRANATAAEELMRRGRPKKANAFAGQTETIP